MSEHFFAWAPLQSRTAESEWQVFNAVFRQSKALRILRKSASGTQGDPWDLVTQCVQRHWNLTTRQETGHKSLFTPDGKDPPEASISRYSCVERSSLAPACSRTSETLDLDVVLLVDFWWLDFGTSVHVVQAVPAGIQASSIPIEEARVERGHWDDRNPTRVEAAKNQTRQPAEQLGWIICPTMALTDI